MFEVFLAGLGIVAAVTIVVIVVGLVLLADGFKR